MPHSRFFLDEPFDKNKEITLKDSEFHHLGVMKKQKGQLIQVVNGKNQLAIGKIVSFTNKNATIEITEILQKLPTKPAIIIAQAMIRPPKLDLILEKCTELGASEFIIFKGDLSEFEDLSKNREQRFYSILISSIKQCGRLDLPKISFVDNHAKFKKLDYEFFYGDINSCTFWDIQSLKKLQKPVCIIIGPEKGLSENEKSFFKEELKATPIKINCNILRTETAAIAAAAVLSQLHLK